MKIKYKFSIVWVTMAFVWLLITLFLLNNYAEKVDVSVLPAILFLPAVIIVYFICMPLITYISFDEKRIQIHKSFIIFKHKFELGDIHHCSVMGKDFVFFTKNQDVYPIHMDWIRKEEMLRLAEFMVTRVRIEDKDNNSFSIDTLKESLK